ncbi:MAG: nucleoside deaminase [Candidatus Omnitrophica bacterium]|nr:nucleoside deaminase [Candidatus Omnitrophota bacterium]
MEKLKQEYMLLAIAQAKKNFKSLAGGPFGACIVKHNKVLSVAHNTVLKEDATCHAEVNAIRQASRKLKSFDLSGCVIYSTTEPCPMCFSAIHWARIDTIVYGTSILDAKQIGFCELSISCNKLNRLGGAKIKIIPGFFYEECLRLFQQWDKLENKQVY